MCSREGKSQEFLQSNSYNLYILVKDIIHNLKMNIKCLLEKTELNYWPLNLRPWNEAQNLSQHSSHQEILKHN